VTSATPSSNPASSTSAGAPRRRLPREARARQLLDVAEEVFTERGVQSSSMDDIAAAAGITKPILYDHFGSKDRLLAAVILRASSVLGDAVLAQVTAAPTPEEALARGLRAYFGFIAARRSGLHSLLTEGMAPGSEAAAAMETVRNQQAEMIAALLVAQSSAAQGDESTDSAQVQLYAQIVVGATERLATRSGASSTPSVETLTRHVMDVIWCGLGTVRDGVRWEPQSAT
jgi:AcrR family transcriptional regulator